MITLSELNQFKLRERFENLIVYNDLSVNRDKSGDYTSQITRNHWFIYNAAIDKLCEILGAGEKDEI